MVAISGKEIMIENCHWGGDGPWSQGDLNPEKDPHWCPFNFFRTSGDIGPSWGSVMGNLQTVVKWQPWNGSVGPVKTGPGCYAYVYKKPGHRHGEKDDSLLSRVGIMIRDVLCS